MQERGFCSFFKSITKNGLAYLLGVQLGEGHFMPHVRSEFD